MDPGIIFIIVTALSLNGFSQSAIHYLHSCVEWKNSLRIALITGLVQIIMLILGWAFGFLIRELLVEHGEKLAFALILITGIKMVWEGFRVKISERFFKTEKLSQIILLAVATSTGSLLIGLAFAIDFSPVLLPAVLLGLLTFVLTLSGFYAGQRFGLQKWSNGSRIVAGLMLVAAAAKIILSNLYY